MITWTSAGAVRRPTTLQIRVQRSFPGRVRAGAPVPTRSMSEQEVLDNLRFFTEGQRGPRTKPCDRLVLSGVGVAGRPDTAAAIDAARGWGMTSVVLHAGAEDLAGLDVARYAGRVELLVVPVTGEAGARAVQAAHDAGIAVVASVVLDADNLATLADIARAVAAAAPSGAVLTSPFPVEGVDGDALPRPAAVVAALADALPILAAAGVKADVKGLPACYLGSLGLEGRRSANRWYVDAEHQRGEAILFFPEVVRFTKDEGCRFCDADGRCDGFFAEWLRLEGFPRLSPIELSGSAPAPAR